NPLSYFSYTKSVSSTTDNHPLLADTSWVQPWLSPRVRRAGPGGSFSWLSSILPSSPSLRGAAPMSMRRASLAGSLAVACIAAAAGFWAGNAVDRTRAEEGTKGKAAAKTYKTGDGGENYLRQSPAAVAVGGKNCDYGLGDCAADKLKPYPAPC